MQPNFFPDYIPCTITTPLATHENFTKFFSHTQIRSFVLYINCSTLCVVLIKRRSDEAPAGWTQTNTEPQKGKTIRSRARVNHNKELAWSESLFVEWLVMGGNVLKYWVRAQLGNTVHIKIFATLNINCCGGVGQLIMLFHLYVSVELKDGNWMEQYVRKYLTMGDPRQRKSNVL